MTNQGIKVKYMKPGIVYEIVGDRAGSFQTGAWNGALVKLDRPNLSEIGTGTKMVVIDGIDLYCIKCIKSNNLGYPIQGIYFGKNLGLRVKEHVVL